LLRKVKVGVEVEGRRPTTEAIAVSGAEEVASRMEVTALERMSDNSSTVW